MGVTIRYLTLFLFVVLLLPVSHAKERQYHNLNALLMGIRKNRVKNKFNQLCNNLVGAQKRNPRNKGKYKQNLEVLAGIWLEEARKVKDENRIKNCSLMFSPLDTPKKEELASVIEEKFRALNYEFKTKTCQNVLDNAKGEIIFSIVCERRFFQILDRMYEEWKVKQAQDLITNHPGYSGKRWDKKKKIRMLRVSVDLNLQKKIKDYLLTLKAAPGFQDNKNRQRRVTFYEAKAQMNTGNYQKALDLLKPFQIPTPKEEKRLSVNFGLLRIQLLLLLGKIEQVPLVVTRLRNKVLTKKNLLEVTSLIDFWMSAFNKKKFSLKSGALSKLQFHKAYTPALKLHMCLMLQQASMDPTVKNKTRSECQRVAQTLMKNHPDSPYPPFVLGLITNNKSLKARALRRCQTSWEKNTFQCALFSQL